MAGLGRFEPTIGLEVHVQLATATKMFCQCESSFGNEPNSRTCPICLGLPGSLPVLNSAVVDMAVRAVVAVGGKVNPKSVFARKNYFYPDLPKGYQISQYDQPIGLGGQVTVTTSGGSRKRCGLTRIHLEEDAGKLIHAQPGTDQTSIDYNRCGTPLLEIVSEPAIESPSEAYSYLVALKQLLQYLRLSNADMEKGELRCDANVSVRENGTGDLGVRTEIKNLNSFRAVQKALKYEIERQIALLESGREIEQVTLLWNESSQQVELMRSKEESEDYRYFPEPDLPAVIVTSDHIALICDALPELPSDRLERFKKEYGLRQSDAEILTSTRELADYYEAVAKIVSNPVSAANWVTTELLGHLHQQGQTINESRTQPAQLADLLLRIESGEISGKIAKTVLAEMVQSADDPSDIIAWRGLAQLSDREALDKVVLEVIARNSQAVEQFRKGKSSVRDHLVGEVMKVTKGRANPDIVNELLDVHLTK